MRNFHRLLIIFFFSLVFKLSAQSEIDQKKLYYDSVYHSAVKQKNELLMAEANYLYGKYYRAKSEYFTAANYLLKALDTYQKYPPSEKTSKTLIFLIFTFLETGDGDSGFYYIKQLYEVQKVIKPEESYSTAIGSIINFLVLDIPFSDSTNTLILAAKDSLMSNSYLGILDNKILGRHYFVGQDYNKSLEYFNKYYLEAKQILGKDRDCSPDLIESLLSISHCLLRLNNLENAKKKLDEASQLIEKHFPENATSISQCLNIYQEYYSEIGDWENAYLVSRKINDLEARRLKTNINGAVSELGIKYEIKQKEQRLSSQNEALDNRNRLLVILTFCFLVASALGIVFFNLFLKNKRLTRRNLYLLKEQNHRVKNNLQQIINLLNLQGRRLKDTQAKKAIEESKLRIDSMSILQKQLYEDREEIDIQINQYFEEIVDSILNTYGIEQIGRILEIEEIRMSPDDAMALGLLITELLTNACKYAFPKNSSPLLQIQFKVQNDNRFFLTFSDNGPGFPKTKYGPGSFGMTLIDLEARYFNGTYDFLNQDGLKFHLEGKLKQIFK